MTRDEIWSRLTRVFQDALDIEDLSLTAETTADDVPGWDSVTHIQLVVAAEAEFGVRFQTGEVAGLANVGEIVELIERRTAEKLSQA